MKRRKTKKKCRQVDREKSVFFQRVVKTRRDKRYFLRFFFPLFFVFLYNYVPVRYISSYVHHTMLLMAGGKVLTWKLFILFELSPPFDDISCHYFLLLRLLFAIYICVLAIYALAPQNDDVECRKRCVYSNYKIPTLDSTSNVNKLFFRHTFSWGAIPPSFSLNLTSMEIFAFFAMMRFFSSSLEWNFFSHVSRSHRHNICGWEFQQFRLYVTSQPLPPRVKFSFSLNFLFREVSQFRAVRRQ